jgi:hypothetical protein
MTYAVIAALIGALGTVGYCARLAAQTSDAKADLQVKLSAAEKARDAALADAAALAAQNEHQMSALVAARSQIADLQSKLLKSEPGNVALASVT